MIDFLGIGAQKGGTTWLYERLKQHPSVKFPAEKEVHFWDRDRDRGSDYWLDLFRGNETGCKQGEITPSYAILEPDIIRQIADLVPELRIFYSIRNPTARAWSAALMALRRSEMTIDEASDTWFIDHFKSAGSRQRGDYVRCLQNWEASFPLENIHIIWFDDLVREPKNVLAGVARHIGVDPDFFLAKPEREIAKPECSGPGHPLRPRLREYLHLIYRRPISDLENHLGRYLSSWLT